MGETSLLGVDPARFREARLLDIRPACYRQATTKRSTRRRFTASRRCTGLCALSLDSIDMARKLLLSNVVSLVSLQDVLHNLGHAGKLRSIDRLRLGLVGRGMGGHGVGWADSLETGLQAQHCTLAFNCRPTSRVLLQCPRLVRSRSYLSGGLLGGNDLTQLLTMSENLRKKSGAPAH